MKKIVLAYLACALAVCFAAQGEPFQFPTANHALYTPGGEDQFFVGTAGRDWVSGTFGSVRSGGWQMHEGLDIRSLAHDRRGEPTDPVLATADGTVAYISTRPALSNYGKYVVIRHQVDGIEVYSLYAHLAEIAAGLAPGQPVKGGQPIGVMGRTSNTRERIGKERAHVHFELNLLYNDRFKSWFKKISRERNDHGDWNGQNMAGLDGRLILLEERNPGFNLATWIRNRPELCRVLVRKADLSWARRYPQLVDANPVAQQQGVAGYEVCLDFNGVPFHLIPRAASEIPGTAKYQLLSVNEAENTKNPCRRLVVKQRGRWQLSNKGVNLLDLLTW